jgi:hypothetical protein
MTDDRKSGIALFAGSLGGLLTMAIHPTGGGSLTPGQARRLSIQSGGLKERLELAILAK